MKALLIFVLSSLFTSLGLAEETKKPAKPEPSPAPAPTTVVMTTSLGEIHLELDEKNAPKTVANFLKYVDADFYDGTVFHRIINGFMIQGGGFTQKGDSLEKKKTNPPVVNESKNTPPNTRGTIAMARTSIPDSATCQFFINVVDNGMLDYPKNGGGYATFGKVTKGMEVVDQIKAVKTSFKSGMSDVPVEPVVIKSVKRLKK